MRLFSTLRILPRSGRIACVLRSRASTAEPPAESPSTMKSSASDGSLTEQSASLPGSVELLERGLAAREVARLACRRARLRGGHGLADHAARVLRVLLEPLGQARVDDRLDEAGHARVAELGLGLTLELRLGELRRDDRGEALADVLAGEVVVLLLELADVARVLVDDAGQRRAEAAEVRAALVRVDVVGEREDRLLVGGVPLHRDLDRALVELALEGDDLAVDRLLVLVEVGDEVGDAALVVEVGAVALAALVDDRDAQVPGQEGGLAQALLERLEVELERLEDVGVGQEGDRRAVLARSARRASIGPSRGAALVASASTRSRRGGPRRRAARRAR